VVRRGVVGWRNEDVAVVQRLKLDDRQMWGMTAQAADHHNA